jgi:hypothetical protein
MLALTARPFDGGGAGFTEATSKTGVGAGCPKAAAQQRAHAKRCKSSIMLQM